MPVQKASGRSLGFAALMMLAYYFAQSGFVDVPTLPVIVR